MLQLFRIATFLTWEDLCLSISYTRVCVVQAHILPAAHSPSPAHKHTFSYVALGSSFCLPRCFFFSEMHWKHVHTADCQVAVWALCKSALFSLQLLCFGQCLVLLFLLGWFCQIIFGFSNYLCHKLVLISARDAPQTGCEYSNRSSGQAWIVSELWYNCQQLKAVLVCVLLL